MIVPQQHYPLSPLPPGANYLSHSLLCSEFPSIHLYPSAAELQNGIGFSLRTVLPKNRRTIFPTRCDSIIFVPHPKQSVYFVLLDTITKLNLVFCPRLPYHSCSGLSRICLTHLVSVLDILSPGCAALFLSGISTSAWPILSVILCLEAFLNYFCVQQYFRESIQL